MKKYLCIILALAMVIMLSACSFTNADGTDTVAGVAMEQGVRLLARLLESVILIAATWVLSKIGKKEQLQNITTAFEQLTELARQTVGELQQVFVDDWKRTGDGKLTPEQITTLQSELLRLTKEKLSDPARALIEAAGMDLNAIIIGEAEAWIRDLKQETVTYTYEVKQDKPPDEKPEQDDDNF